MTAKFAQSGIICDANVLIDYSKSAPTVLELISKHVCKLHVALPVLREVDQLSTTTTEALKIDLIEPTLTQLVDAAGLSVSRILRSQDRTHCVSYWPGTMVGFV